jgi:hypothetical protein
VATTTLPAAAAALIAELSSGTSPQDRVQQVPRVPVRVLLFALGGNLGTGYAQGDLTVLFTSSTDIACMARNSGVFCSLCLIVFQLLPGPVATSTTLLVGLSATGATHQGKKQVPKYAAFTLQFTAANCLVPFFLCPSKGQIPDAYSVKYMCNVRSERNQNLIGNLLCTCSLNNQS